MQSSAARVLEEYEYSREYHSAPKQEAPKLQVRERSEEHTSELQSH